MIAPVVIAALIASAAQTAMPVPAETLAHRGALWRLLVASGRPPPYHDAAEAAVFAPIVKTPPWRRLLETSAPYAIETGNAGTTLWWNAAADAGLLIRWQRGADGWRAVSSQTYVGGEAGPAAAAQAARAALAATGSGRQ